MNREDIQKLLGGYGTGTLTLEEQQALFAAALEDQELFDALGREQALRDLLRDPGAKAELLAALDTPVREGAGYWGWLRRPLVAGLATAGVAAIAVVAVWQGTRGKPAAPAPEIIAEMKAPERKAQETNTPAIGTKAPDLATHAPAKRAREVSSPRDATDIKVESLKKERALPVDAALPAPLPAGATSANQPGAASQTVEVTAEASSAGVKPPAAAVPPKTQELSTLQQKLSSVASTTGRMDARTLFYGNMFLPRPNALVQPLAAGGQSQNAPVGSSAAMRAATGNFAKPGSTTSRLGVRVSILRGDEEAAVTTVLDAGESVRLKLVPNEDGFLYAAAREGNVWKMVASDAVQRLKPFETPPLPFYGPGTKQLYVMLSRQAQTVSPQALPGMARNNLVETLADQDRATYVVAAPATDSPQQVVQAITLTYR